MPEIKEMLERLNEMSFSDDAAHYLEVSIMKNLLRFQAPVAPFPLGESKATSEKSEMVMMEIYTLHQSRHVRNVVVDSTRVKKNRVLKASTDL